MLGLEGFLEEFSNYAFEQPVILTALVAGFIGLLYYLGWIINSNDWQYLNTKKEGQIYRGFMFLSSNFFLPSIALLGLIYLLNWEYIFSNFFRQINILTYFIILIVIFIFFFEKLDNIIFNEIRKFKTRPLVKAVAINTGGLNYIFILLNLAIIVSIDKYYSKLVLFLILIWLDIWILAKWARLSSLYHQAAEAVIQLTNNEKFEVRLIEFIEDGKFIKVQKKDKKSNNVIAIPINNIEKIELLTYKPLYDFSELIEDLKKKKDDIQKKSQKK
jgi:hypothetical protein